MDLQGYYHRVITVWKPGVSFKILVGWGMSGKCFLKMLKSQRKLLDIYCDEFS